MAIVEAGGDGRIEVEVRSSDGDTLLAELAPKARSLVNGMEGEVARTNRCWRRIAPCQGCCFLTGVDELLSAEFLVIVTRLTK